MSKNFRNSLKSDYQYVGFKKELIGLHIENKLDQADDFSKNHDKRLSHDEVFNSIRLKLNNI